MCFFLCTFQDRMSSWAKHLQSDNNRISHDSLSNVFQLFLVSNGGKFMKKTLIGEAYIWLDKVDMRKRVVSWHKLFVSSTQTNPWTPRQKDGDAINQWKVKSECTSSEIQFYKKVNRRNKKSSRRGAKKINLIPSFFLYFFSSYVKKGGNYVLISFISNNCISLTLPAHMSTSSHVESLLAVDFACRMQTCKYHSRHWNWHCSNMALRAVMSFLP